MTVELHQGDLPSDIDFGKSIAIDTETQGLNPLRDRLCLIQMSSGDGTAHLVQFEPEGYDAPNLKRVLADPDILKIYHFARFDLAVIHRYLGIMTTPVYCTKVASRLVRTYTDRHGLKDLCRELIGLDLSKQQQSSDWAAKDLSKEQLNYAASDVLHLHALKEKLDMMLAREARREIAQTCFGFLPMRAELDLKGWQDEDIFSH